MTISQFGQSQNISPSLTEPLEVSSLNERQSGLVTLASIEELKALADQHQKNGDSLLAAYALSSLAYKEIETYKDQEADQHIDAARRLLPVWYKQQFDVYDSVCSALRLNIAQVAQAKLEARDKEIGSQKANSAILELEFRSRLTTITLAFLVILTLLGYYTLYNKQKSNPTQTSPEVEPSTKQSGLSLNTNSDLYNLQELSVVQKYALLQSLEADLSQVKTDLKPSAAHHTDSDQLHESIMKNETASKDSLLYASAINDLQDGFSAELNRRHSKLTANDKRLISLIRLNMSSKEIAIKLNISAAGVKKARYRLRKKLKLEPGSKVTVYLQEIADAAEKRKTLMQ